MTLTNWNAICCAVCFKPIIHRVKPSILIQGRKLLVHKCVFQKGGKKKKNKKKPNRISQHIQYELLRHPYCAFSTVSSSHEEDEWCVRKPCGKLACVKQWQLRLCLLCFVVTGPTAICHTTGASAYSGGPSPSCSVIHHIESWWKTFDFN